MFLATLYLLKHLKIHGTISSAHLLSICEHFNCDRDKKKAFNGIETRVVSKFTLKFATR